MQYFLSATIAKQACLFNPRSISGTLRFQIRLSVAPIAFCSSYVGSVSRVPRKYEHRQAFQTLVYGFNL